jgi:hypothetical protein
MTSLDEARLLRKRKGYVDELVQERDRQRARALLREIKEIEATLAQVRARDNQQEEDAA